MMRIMKFINLILASCALLISSVCSAGFATYSKDWPDDAASVDEKVSSIDTSAEPCPPPAESCPIDIIGANGTGKRVCEDYRLYAKFGVTFLSAQIRQIQNTSLPALSSAYLINQSAKENYISWEFGLGTSIDPVRMELEYLYEKNVPYNATPLFAGRSENLTSTLMVQSLWFDLMYDLKKLNLPYFTPYIGGLLGISWNKTESTMYGGIGTNAEKNHSRISIGWGATIGARMPFWERWFGYFGYKYLDHGMVRWQDSTGVMGLKGHYVLQGFELGVQYLLG